MMTNTLIAGCNALTFKNLAIHNWCIGVLASFFALGKIKNAPLPIAFLFCSIVLCRTCTMTRVNLLINRKQMQLQNNKNQINRREHVIYFVQFLAAHKQWKQIPSYWSRFQTIFNYKKQVFAHIFTGTIQKEPLFISIPIGIVAIVMTMKIYQIFCISKLVI